MSKLASPFSASKVAKACYCLAFLSLTVYLLFYHTFTFNYETYLNQQYMLVFWLPILAITLIWLYKNVEYYGKNLGVGLMSMAIVSCFLCFSHYYSFGNEYFFTLSIIAAACYGVFLFNRLTLFRVIISFFVLAFILQLYLGIQQEFASNSNNSLSITGSLQNSGVYAYYLVFNLPFFYWVCFSFGKFIFKENYSTTSNIIFKVFFAFVLAMVCYLIYCTQSRTAFICLVVTIGYFLFLTYKNSIFAVVTTLPKSLMLAIGVVGIGCIAGVGVWLLSFKKLSAMGRILTLDITWQHITDHFWFGTGLGRFTWYYPQWQSVYFSTHPKAPITYFFSAGESYIIFNEYLQLLKTVGLFGFLLCGYILFRFFNLHAVNYPNLLKAAKCTVLAILCSGFTSYPLHVNIILLLLGTCLAIGFRLASQESTKPAKRWVYMNKALIIICFLLVCGISVKGYPLYKASAEWASLRNTGSGRVLTDYKELFATLNSDGKFLIEYGTILLTDSTQSVNAMGVLEQARQLLITRQGIEALTTAYIRAEKIEDAVANQQFLANYLPHTFLPKYSLLELYVLQADTVKIVEMGNKILKMPVKIPSYEVTKIKQRTREILKNYL